MTQSTPTKLSSAQRLGLVLCGIFVAAGLAVMALRPAPAAAPEAPALPADTIAPPAAPTIKKTKNQSDKPRAEKPHETPRNFLDDDF